MSIKKISILLVSFLSLFVLYGEENVSIKKGIKIRNAKLGEMLGSVSKFEEEEKIEELPLYSKLIVKDRDEKEIYDNLSLFSSITFGYNPIYADHMFNSDFHPYKTDRRTVSFGNMHQHYIKQGIEIVSNVVKQKEKKDNNYTLHGKLYFVLPDLITSSYSLSIYIEEKEYNPTFIKDDSSHSMFLISKELNDINDNDRIKIVFTPINEKKEDKVELTYRVEKIEKDIFYDTVTSLDRMEKSISEINPSLSYSFGIKLYEENFQYSVKELTDEKGIDKAIEKDVRNLSKILDKESKEFYKSNYNLFNPKFALYEDQGFIIGIESIYLSSINKTATFSSNGDVILSK